MGFLQGGDPRESQGECGRTRTAAANLQAATADRHSSSTRPISAAGLRPLYRSGALGHTVEVLIDHHAVRIEQADHLLVSHPCVYDTGQRRITAVDACEQ